MFPAALCTFGAVPFAYTDSDNRPMLAINPTQMPWLMSAAGDANVVGDLARALLRLMPPSAPANEEPVRRQRTRHNAGSGAAEDFPMAPLPDIITSSSSRFLEPVSPGLTIDSGLGSPRDDAIFSFDEELLASYDENQGRAASTGSVFEDDDDMPFMPLADPPRGRRSRAFGVSFDDEGFDADEDISMADADQPNLDESFDDRLYAVAPKPNTSTPARDDDDDEQKSGYESVVIDMPGDDDVFVASHGASAIGNQPAAVAGPSAPVNDYHRRADRRWKKLGGNLREIADDFQLARTGEATVQPWTVNFGEFFRLVFSFIWGRLVRRWFNF